MNTKVSIIWEEAKRELEPIRLLKYVNPRTGTGTQPTDTKAGFYEMIVKIRGDQNCIVMCYKASGDKEHEKRDIFLAEWNDGVVEECEDE